MVVVAGACVYSASSEHKGVCMAATDPYLLGISCTVGHCGRAGCSSGADSRSGCCGERPKRVFSHLLTAWKRRRPYHYCQMERLRPKSPCLERCSEQVRMGPRKYLDAESWTRILLKSGSVGWVVRHKDQCVALAPGSRNLAYNTNLQSLLRRSRWQSLVAYGSRKEAVLVHSGVGCPRLGTLQSDTALAKHDLSAV